VTGTLLTMIVPAALVAADFALFRLRRYRDERDDQAWRKHEESALALANGDPR